MWKPLAVVIAGLLVAQASLAQVPVGSPFLVSSYSTDDQLAPEIAMDADGDFVVVWQSNGSDTGDSSGWSIQARRYSSDGALGAPFQVNAHTTGDQTSPAITVDADGDFFVVWTNSSVNSVEGRRYSSDGSAQGSLFQVSSPDLNEGTQFGARVGVDSNGNHVVIWRSEIGSRVFVYGQRYAADGNELGGQFLVWDFEHMPGTPVDLAVASDGAFTVARTSERLSPTFGLDVRARRFSADGTALDPIFRVPSDTDGRHARESLASGPNGEFVVAWQRRAADPGPLDGYGIQARRFTSQGDPADESFQVDTHTVLDQTSPDVAVGPNGDFVVVWETPNPVIAGGPPAGHVPGIHGRLFAADGSPRGPQFFVDLPAPETNSNLGAPKVALGANGDFVVVWPRREEESGWNLYGRRFCTDEDLDGSCNAADLCVGDDATGDTDGDGICDDTDVCDGTDPEILCLHKDRFKVEVHWRDFQNHTGSGRTVARSNDSGLFWFFDADNWELLVKVLDGCSVNQHTWVFAAATTNVEHTLRVTDTQTGAEKEYFNPLGEAAAALTDTTAFETCP